VGPGMSIDLLMFGVGLRAGSILNKFSAWGWGLARTSLEEWGSVEAPQNKKPSHRSFYSTRLEMNGFFTRSVSYTVARSAAAHRDERS